MPVNQSASYAGAAVVDNTAPRGLTLTIANGATIRRPDANDTLTFVWAEVIDPISMLAGWAGTASNVTVRITNGTTGNDVLTVWNSANTAQLPFGSLDLGSGSYVAATTTFGAPAAAARSTMTWTNDRIVVRLGTASATATATTTTGTFVGRRRRRSSTGQETIDRCDSDRDRHRRPRILTPAPGRPSRCQSSGWRR